jgi:hypothetical protein
MASDARTKIVLELAAEFVEDHVRTRSAQPFGLAEVKHSLGTLLREAEVAVDLRSSDEQWLSDWLDRHPLLLKRGSGPQERGRRVSTQAPSAAPRLG